MKEIRGMRQKARARVKAPPELKDELECVKTALKMMLDHRRETKKARHAAKAAELEAHKLQKLPSD